MHQHVGDDAEEDTVGDGVAERHHDDGDERRDGLAVVVPVDAGDGRHHHHTDQHEGGSRRSAGDGEEDRAEQEGQAEADGHGEGRKTGAAAFTDTRGALDIGRGRGGTEAGTGDGSDGICIFSRGKVWLNFSLLKKVTVNEKAGKGFIVGDIHQQLHTGTMKYTFIHTNLEELVWQKALQSNPCQRNT